MKRQLISLVCRYCKSVFGEAIAGATIAYCPRCKNGKSLYRIKKDQKRIRERAS